MYSHLEKEFQQIERRYKKQPAEPMPIEACQRFLETAASRMKHGHQDGVAGRMVANGRSHAIDILLTHLWEDALGRHGGVGTPAAKCPMALVALGGYGRAQLNPYSDVDIMFLHGAESRETEDAIKPLVESVLYPLWDAGLKVGHSTRTVAQAIENANSEPLSKTAILESRLICGDDPLFKIMQARFLKKCVEGHEDAFIQWRFENQSQRHAKYGGSVFMQEPHVKEGCGGLRDYHNLIWIAYFWKRIREIDGLVEVGVLTKEESAQLEGGFDFLMRVRNQMHFMAGRENNQLSLSLQGRVATGLGYEERPPVRRVEAFMRDYYQAAQAIHFLTNAATWKMAQLSKNRKQFWMLRFLPSMPGGRKKHVDDFAIKNGEITSENRNVFNEDPIWLIKVFLVAQREELAMSYDLLRLVRRHLPLLTRQFIQTKAVTEIFSEIFTAKGRVAKTARLMHQTGVLGKVIPEFEPLTCLVQHEFFHRYSADEHTLMCIEHLDHLVRFEGTAPSVQGFVRYQAIMKSIEHPLWLYLAMLLHDAGKSMDTDDHSEMSALMAVKVAKRMKLPSEAMKMLTFLADHHLTMSHTAQRRNVDDEETIREFAGVVETPSRLDHLMLVSYADGRGTTGGESWSDWKETLMWHLYDRTRLLLEGSPEFEKKASQRIEEMQERIVAKLPKSVPKSEVFIHFKCLPPRYSQMNQEQEITKHIVAVHEFLKCQAELGTDPLKPVILWVHYQERGHSELVVVTWDRSQLVSRVTGALAVAGLNILSAGIFTRSDHIVVDAFRICTDRNEAVTDVRDQKLFAETLEKSLSGDTFDFGAQLKKLLAKRPVNRTGADGFPTKLVLDNSSLQNNTLCEIQTPDRPGLLHELVTCLTREDLQITFARIETEKGAAIDTFYLSDIQGRKIMDDAALQKLKKEVLQCADA